MAAIHAELDRLGYRWVGGSGQGECAPFGWGPGEEGKRAALGHLRSRASELVSRAGRGTARLQWLVSRMDWALDYDAAEQSATSASALLARASDPRTSNATELARQAMELLNDDLLARALHSYARRVTTRGEYGVLATINTKAVVDWRRLRAECAAMLGTDATSGTASQWTPEPAILLPRFLGSAPADRDLQLEPLVLGGKPAWIHYRQLGTKQWDSQPLEAAQGWVRRIVVPAGAVRSPGLEVAFSFDADAAHEFALGPLGVTVMPQTEVVSQRSETEPATTVTLNLRSRRGKSVPVELSWNDVNDAVFYRVWRNGAPVAETAVAFFPDCPREERVTYQVEAIRDGRVIARSGERRISVPRLPVTEPVRLAARATRSGVVVRWPAARSANLTSYTLTRIPANGKGEALVREITADRRQAHVLLDTPPPGRWTYRVVPVGIRGAKGRAVSVTLEYPPSDVRNQQLDLPLTEAPSIGTVEGRVEFGPDGARLGKGAIIVPHGTMMDPEFGMTLEFEFKAESTAETPVLMSCGFWAADGWFVQLIDGKLLIRTPNGDAHGPAVEPGRWYRVKWTHDGQEQHLSINDTEIKQEQGILPTVPGRRNLVIGQYALPEPKFAFNGFIRNLRIAAGVDNKGN